MLNKRKQTRKVNLQKDCKPNKLFFPPLKLEKATTMKQAHCNMPTEKEEGKKKIPQTNGKKKKEKKN